MLTYIHICTVSLYTFWRGTNRHKKGASLHWRKSVKAYCDLVFSKCVELGITERPQTVSTCLTFAQFVWFSANKVSHIWNCSAKWQNNDMSRPHNFHSRMGRRSLPTLVSDRGRFMNPQPAHPESFQIVIYSSLCIPDDLTSVHCCHTRTKKRKKENGLVNSVKIMPKIWRNYMKKIKWYLYILTWLFAHCNMKLTCYLVNIFKLKKISKEGRNDVILPHSYRENLWWNILIVSQFHVTVAVLQLNCT